MIWAMDRFILVSFPSSVVFSRFPLIVASVNTNHMVVEKTDNLRLAVVFPTDKIAIFAEKLPVHLQERFSVEKFSCLIIRLDEGANVDVDGFAMPYSNSEHVCHSWLHGSKPVALDLTFYDILKQREWRLIVREKFDNLSRHWPRILDSLSSSFPYGEDHSYDLTKYELEFAQGISRGRPYLLSTEFRSVNDMLAVLSQSAVQDCFWLARDAAQIFTIKIPTYFIPVGDASAPSQYYAILEADLDVFRKHRKTFGRLTHDGYLRIAFHTDSTPLPVPDLADHQSWHKLAQSVWNAKLIYSPNRVPGLAAHLSTYQGTIVLLVSRLRDAARGTSIDGSQAVAVNPKTFASRDLALHGRDDWNTVSILLDTGLTELPRRVGAVNLFDVRAEPTHIASSVYPDVATCMELHRDLQLGRGFPSLWKNVLEGEILFSASSPWGLPTMNTLSIVPALAKALLQELVPEERSRFTAYLERLPLAFGLIIAVSTLHSSRHHNAPFCNASCLKPGSGYPS